MPTDLAQFIASATVVDSHEHLASERQWVEHGPADVLADLFDNYVQADLISAGATAEQIRRLLDGSDPDVEGRWSAVEDAWRAVEHTGFAEAVKLCARHVYGIDQITPAALRAAQPRLNALRRPGQRLHLLRDLARLDHTQTDNNSRVQTPDASGPDFFFYDISWLKLALGKVEPAVLAAETGVEVTDLPSLRRAMETIFEQFGAIAIAVKTQHAVVRTLSWQKRSDADAARALDQLLRDGADVDEATRLCLGDWCLAQAAELAGQHNLPLKIHTGYCAGNTRLIDDRLRPGRLSPLIREYPGTRFVLMHASIPYSDELLAVVKHYPNAYADLCWAWAISPRATAEFVRRFIHAAPANKLFAFGGDTHWPTMAYAYSLQMRNWLTRTLQAEVDAGDLTEPAAIALAERFLYNNQINCFDVERARTANLKAVHASSG